VPGIDVGRDAVEVGIVLSGASAGLAPIMVRRDRELEVREEDLVLIADERLDGYYMLGVVRWVTRHEPFLRRAAHNVYAEHPEALDDELVMPFTNAYVEIYGGLCGGQELCGGAEGLVSNVYAPTPGSRVYRLTRGDVLDPYLGVPGERRITLGAHKYTGWRLPLDTGWASYHIGVFGATGTGKSRLVARLARELSRVGYGLIVFDHSGVDYAPRAGALGARVVRSREVRINPLVFASTVARHMGVTGQQRDAVEVAAACFAMKIYREQGAAGYESRECEEALRSYTRRQASLAAYTGQQGGQSVRDRFLQEALEPVMSKFNFRDATRAKLRLIAKLAVPEAVFEALPGRRTEPLEIVEEAAKGKIIILDMSDEQDIEVKRAILASTAMAAWEKIWATMRPLNAGIVVDEAQNYACEYCGESAKALETIAREGRKWGLFLTVASQRVSRDIKPGIRSNLGTVFFSRLQATGDLQELSGYLDLGRVTEASLAMLARREFYTAGLMNPLRRPLLLRVDETP